MQNLLVNRWFSLLLATIVSPLVSAEAQTTFCVRAGATGANNGSDWNNAYSSLPATLQRGAFYYVADGSYSGWALKTANSGSTLITIKKATEADHGTGTGWQSTYGDGQAAIASLNFSSSYWVIDGVTGNGFSKLPADTTGANYGFYISDDLNPIMGGNAAAASNIAIKHCYMLGRAGAYSKWAIYPDTYVNDVSNWTISYCLLDRWGNGVAFGGRGPVTGWIFEYNICLRGYSTAAFHGEWINASGASVSGMIVRWNLFKGMEEGGLTACIVANNADNSNGQVYGNVFHDLAVGNGTISGTSVASLLNTVIYNNTFINCGEGPWVGGGSSSSGQIAKNNLIYNMDASRSVTTGDYNYYCSTTATPSETHGQIGSGNPFVNLSGGDYRLTSDSAAGDTSISATYRTDALGKSGSSRGAFQFGGGTADTTPPTFSNISAAGVTTNSATITFTTSEAAQSGVQVGTTTSYGTSATNGTLQTSSSFALTGLTPNTTYHYRTHATDAAGNHAQSSDQMFTTLVPDVTPPSVALTAPAAGTTVSNTVSLAATATDNIGVAAVDFRVDGAVVNTDVTPPYAITWSTQSVTNGSHTISAVARDAAGNSTTSSATVIVQNATPTITTGLIGYWTFNETSGSTASDSSGNGNNASVINGGAWVAGESAGSVLLDGIDDCVVVPTSTTMETTSGSVTVSAWVKVEANGQWQAIARKVLQDGTHVFPFSAYDLIVEDTGTPLPRMAVSGTDGTRGVAYGSTALNYGQWYHLAGVYDGSAVRIYVNGNQAGSAAFSGALIQTGQPLLIGRNGIGGDILKGSVDELRVYNRALSAAEIQTLAAPGTSPVPPSNLRVAGN